MDKTLLETEKAALEAELADKEAKAIRLSAIEMCLNDIAKTEQAEALIKSNPVSQFFFSKNKNGGMTVQFWEQDSGKKLEFSTDRVDNLVSTKEITITFSIPVGMTTMQQYLLATGAVMKQLLQRRIDFLTK